MPVDPLDAVRPELLERLLDAALTAPGNTEDSPAAEVVARLLVALAQSSEEDRVARYFGVEDGTPSTFRLRSWTDGGSPVEEGGLSPRAAVLAADERTTDPDVAVELLYEEARSPGEQLVMSAKAGEPLAVRFSSIAAAPAPEVPNAAAPPGTTVGEEVARLVREALAELTVQVDVEEMAAVTEQMTRQIAHSLRVPNAHDVADVIAPLIPSPEDMAAVVSERMSDQLPAVRSPALPERTAAVSPMVLDQVEVELATLHDQLRAAQRSFETLTDEVAGAARRSRDQSESLASAVQEDLQDLTRRIDQRLSERPPAVPAAGSSAVAHRFERATARLEAVCDRLDALVRRLDQHVDPRAMARLARLLAVASAHLGVRSEELAYGQPGGEPHREHPLRLVDDQGTVRPTGEDSATG